MDENASLVVLQWFRKGIGELIGVAVHDIIHMNVKIPKVDHIHNAHIIGTR
jgi:hypothetical protein